jgi:hypothetical protein
VQKTMKQLLIGYTKIVKERLTPNSFFSESGVNIVKALCSLRTHLLSHQSHDAPSGISLDHYQKAYSWNCAMIWFLD